MIQWKKFIFTINDVYGPYNKKKNMSGADVHCFFQQKGFIHPDKRMSLHRKVKTLCLDLDKPVDQLRKEMNKSTRYQINRAGRENLPVNFITEPTRQDVVEYTKFYNSFARAKGIELCRLNKLEAMRIKNKIIISYVLHEDGRKLIGNLNIVDGVRVTSLYSGSSRFTKVDIPSSVFGRANRYLTWLDMMFFKERGYLVYDFLGLSLDQDDTEQQNLNDFKRGFGGREEVNYQSFVPMTMKGYLMLLLLRFTWRNQKELVKRQSVLHNNSTERDVRLSGQSTRYK